MRWKHNETVFTVKLFKSTNRNGGESKMCTVPLPLVERFGKCDSLRFEVTEGGAVTVRGV